jgi:hypothetical protein
VRVLLHLDDHIGAIEMLESLLLDVDSILALEKIDESIVTVVATSFGALFRRAGIG